MTSSADQQATLLHEVRQRRVELRASMDLLERALASPSRSGRSTEWADGLRRAVGPVYDAFVHHVAVTEGPEGLYAELAQHSPRLEHAVARLLDEHADIRRRLQELLTWVDVSDEVADVSQARKDGTELLAVLMRHRQRGADLVFEAFDVDIGGET